MVPHLSKRCLEVVRNISLTSAEIFVLFNATQKLKWPFQWMCSVHVSDVVSTVMLCVSLGHVVCIEEIFITYGTSY